MEKHFLRIRSQRTIPLKTCYECLTELIVKDGYGVSYQANRSSRCSKLIKEAERYATRPSGYLEPESFQIGKLETHKGSQFKQTVSHFSLAPYYFCTFCSKS